MQKSPIFCNDPVLRTLFPIAALLCAISSFAQTGPAGVGTTSSNIVWLKADAGSSATTSGNPVSQWNDQSGNGNNVAQTNSARQPLYQNSVGSALNGMPAMEFDNDQTNYDYLTCPDNATLDGYTGMTAFSAFRFNTGTPAGTPRAIFSKRIDPGTNNDFGWFHYTNNNFYLDVNGTSHRMNTSATYTTGTDYLISFSFDAALSSNDQKMYNGNSLDAQSNNPATSVPNYASDFHVGVLYGHTGTYKQFNGYIPEIIIYNTALNPAQRFIVNNYLSAKYNIALASNDYYAGDTPANGDFDREVAGIGQSSAGNTNNAFSSSVCAGMGITYVSGFDDGDYVLAGHNLPVNANINTDIAVVSGGPLQARWQRIWYIDVTNTGTSLTTNFTFDLSDGGFTGTTGLASNYKLLYRSVNSGNWTIIATASATAGDQVYFTNVNLSGNSNDGYYTIGTLDAFNSTLPVEWLYFNLVADGNDAHLSWATATEQNADYFVVERMSNTSSFEDIGTVPAHGNSSMLQTYSMTDENLPAGFYYYRLRETDFNGAFQYSAIRAVEIKERGRGFTVFPNPATDAIFIQPGTANGANALLKIYDSSGRLVQENELPFDGTGSAQSVSIAELPKGVYWVVIETATGNVTERFVKD